LVIVLLYFIFKGSIYFPPNLHCLLFVYLMRTVLGFFSSDAMCFFSFW
jgi:hypothetical protein